MTEKERLKQLYSPSFDSVLCYDSYIYKDSRGQFQEAFADKLDWPKFVQDNISVSKLGVVRGMHYQKDPMAQGKLIRVIRGKILDKVVNLTTGLEHNMELSAEKGRALYVPQGWAHGFQALEDDTIVYYKCTEFYSPEHEVSINPMDFGWPLAVSEISEKDKKGESWAAVRK